MTLTRAMAARGLAAIAATPVEIRGQVWICLAFEPQGEALGDHPHLAMIHAPTDWLVEPDLEAAIASALAGRTDVLVRVHSECILGDAFGSSMCDCGDQLRLSMDEMERRGEGIVMYLRQEGRGIGLRNKLDCLALQYGFRNGRGGHARASSDEANLAMGFAVDERDYDAAARLLQSLGVRSVELVTGNPKKIDDLAAAGVAVSRTLDIWSGRASTRALEEIREKVSRGYIYQR